MNEHDIIQKAFSGLHASDDTLQKVMNRTHSDQSVRMKPKRIAILVAAVAVLFSMVLAVHGSVLVLLGDRLATLTPAENPEQVIDDAFGDKISTEKAPIYDCYGNPIETPNMECPSVDLAEAEKWIGDYINDVDAVTAVGESTFTLKNFLIDETGSGVLTWTVENPNGVSYHDCGYGFVTFNWSEDPFCHPQIKHFGADGQQKKSACEFTALISKSTDGTQLELVTYFGTFDQYEIGDHFVWRVGRTPDTEIKTIQITPVSHNPVKTMATADGMKLTISNHGIAIDVNCNNSFSENKIVIHFEDGTQYCLDDWDNQIYNISGGLWRSYEPYHNDDLVLLFNRLIDTKQVSSVEMTAKIYRTERVGEDYETITEQKHYVFYP